MTQEEQRIVIAEACGLERLPFVAKDEGSMSTWEEWFHSLPDYLNDLNAMHEAENLLNYEQCNSYYDALCNLIGNDEYQAKCVGEEPANAYFFHATAAQRAEAFLKTLNLWKQ